MLTPSGILDLQQFCVLLYFELWYLPGLPWTALPWLDWILFSIYLTTKICSIDVSDLRQPAWTGGCIGLMFCDGWIWQSGSLTVWHCLVLIFLSPQFSVLSSQSASNQQELPLIRRNAGSDVRSSTARHDKFTVIIEQNDIRLVECQPVKKSL